MVPQRRKRSRNIDIEPLRELRRLAMERNGNDWAFGPAKIFADMESQFPSAVTLKQVKEVVKEQRYIDASGRWLLSDTSNDPDDAALVIPVLKHGASVTKLEAAWIVRVRRAVPDLPVAAAITVARTYLSFLERKLDTNVLDYLLSIAPWRTSYEEDAWEGWLYGMEGKEAVGLGRHIIDMQKWEEDQS